MFEKSSAYRYRLSLEINLLESKEQYHVHLKVGYGITNLGENKEFYFTILRAVTILSFHDVQSVILSRA